MRCEEDKVTSSERVLMIQVSRKILQVVSIVNYLLLLSSCVLFQCCVDWLGGLVTLYSSSLPSEYNCMHGN